jgi:SH3-like domain-containing protein
MKIFLILIILSLSSVGFASKFIPYYASIKSSEVNVRKGPNTRYPISWVYKKKGEPVEVIAQFEHWNRIRDVTGDEGWVKTIMLNKKRSAIIIIASNKEEKQKQNVKLFAKLYREPNASSKVFANIESSKRVLLEKCQKQWCQIKVNNILAWIEKQYLWGVYVNEEFK